MILLMERAARLAIEPYLDPGEASVGAMVQVEHLAGTPLGAEVKAVARVTSIQGRSIDFDVTAHDAQEMIGRGSHRRAVVKLAKVARRIADKTLLAGSDPAGLDWLAGLGGLPLTSHPQRSPHAPREAINTGASALAEPVAASKPLPALSTLAVHIDGAVATVTLNRPQKKNAVNIQMTEDWERLVGHLAGRLDIRVVVLRGAGGTFCAGDDIKEVGTLELEQARLLSYRQARLYLAWELLPQLFIAAIDGEALGAGCVAACACDFRIAAHGAQLGMPEILRGWPPGYGIAQLTALVGKARAMQMCVSGQSIAARQALDWGLVHRLVSVRQLGESARRWADELLTLPSEALRETKRLVHADEGLQPKTAYLADTAAYIRCLAGGEASEGVAAFNEKRRPRFG